jgi:branched-chain amino acid transport system substrate-binding protein
MHCVNPRRTLGTTLLIALLALSTFLVNGCNGKKSTPSNQILIGEYGAMTGSESTFGTSTDEGMQMALDEINSAGGVNGMQLAKKAENDESKSDEARTVVQDLMQSHPTAIIGEVASSNSLAAAPVCQNAKVPMISPASTNPKVTEQGDYIFRTCFIDPFQGGVMATFAFKNLHAKKAAVFWDSDQDYSKGLREAFENTFKKLGGQIVIDQSYSSGAVDYRAQLTTIKQANPDVIFIPGYYTEVGTIARQARETGITVPLLGGDGWDSVKLFQGAGGALEGCYFSNHYFSADPKVQKFVAAYKAKYNGKVPDAMAALAYDATRILADALKRAGKPSDGDYTSDDFRAKLRDAIAATKDFNGVTGNITIGPDRNAIKPAIVLQIHGNAYKYVTTITPQQIPS